MTYILASVCSITGFWSPVTIKVNIVGVYKNANKCLHDLSSEENNLKNKCDDYRIECKEKKLIR